VIANTFSILFAQRVRDFALLRCVGATRRQVLRSVRIEALVLGIVSSVAGLLAGTGIGLGLVALVRAVAPSARVGHADLSIRWYVAGLLVGVLVTVTAAWLPTRRVVRVSPLAALGPRATVDVQRSEGRKRVVAGALLGLLGAVLLVLAVSLGEGIPMVLGGASVFTGVLMLGPVLVPAVMRLIGAPLRRLGPSGRLAVGNAARDPRRTAATTASLLVGVTITTAVLTGLASARSSVESEMDRTHPLDVALTVSTDEPLPAGLLDDARAASGVDDAEAVLGARGTVAGVGPMTVLAPTSAQAAAASYDSSELVAPRPGVILLPSSVARRLEDKRVVLTVQGVELTLKVRSGEGWGNAAAIVAPATLRRLTADPATAAVWVKAAPDADAEDLLGDLSALVSGVGGEVEDGLSKRAYVDQQLDVLTASVLGLLGIAVVVALIGIANTLGLSVLERVREHALLRALGLTRRQLRATLALEAVLCTAVAAVMGTVLGVLFAWVGVQALVRQVVDETPFVLPVGQLGLVVLGAGLAGLLAAVLPARRAARVSPAAGLTFD
jgi:putative ABC transport system permease protein